MKSFGYDLVMKENGWLYYKDNYVYEIDLARDYYVSLIYRNKEDEENYNYANIFGDKNERIAFYKEFLNLIKESSEEFKRFCIEYKGKIKVDFWKAKLHDFITISVDSNIGNYDMCKINFYLKYGFGDSVNYLSTWYSKLNDLYLFRAGYDVKTKLEKIGINVKDVIDMEDFVYVISHRESFCCREKYDLIKSNRYYLVEGDTYNVKERLKKVGCRFLKCSKGRWHIYIDKNKLDDFKKVFNGFDGEYEVGSNTINVFVYCSCSNCHKRMLSYKLIHLKDCNGIILPFCSECAEVYRKTSWNDRCFA